MHLKQQLKTQGIFVELSHLLPGALFRYSGLAASQGTILHGQSRIYPSMSLIAKISNLVHKNFYSFRINRIPGVTIYFKRRTDNHAVRNA